MEVAGRANGVAVGRVGGVRLVRLMRLVRLVLLRAVAVVGLPRVQLIRCVRRVRDVGRVRRLRRMRRMGWGDRTGLMASVRSLRHVNYLADVMTAAGGRTARERSAKT
jgi:hypothetical protein